MDQNNNTFLLKLSRLLPSSLISCQSKTLPDVADSSFIITKPTNTPHDYLQKHPKPHHIYSPAPNLKPRRKITHPPPPTIHSSDWEGRKCPPVTPASALDPTKTAKPSSHHHSSSSNSGRWFTSSSAADGFDTDTFYSMSSNSGESRAGRRRRRRMKSIDETGWEHEPGSDISATRLYYRSGPRRRRSRRRDGKEAASSSMMIEESLAVEKRTRDPYRDFRASMVEMIMEKGMFGAEELDKLLYCFLGLNKAEYHGIIFEVFKEICETLFCN